MDIYDAICQCIPEKIPSIRDLNHEDVDREKLLRLLARGAPPALVAELRLGARDTVVVVGGTRLNWTLVRLEPRPDGASVWTVREILLEIGQLQTDLDDLLTGMRLRGLLGDVFGTVAVRETRANPLVPGMTLCVSSSDALTLSLWNLRAVMR